MKPKFTLEDVGNYEDDFDTFHIYCRGYLVAEVYDYEWAHEAVRLFNLLDALDSQDKLSPWKS